MALIKEFTDKCGNHYAESYWRANKIYINSDTRTIDLLFLGYRDGQAFADGLEPLQGAVKTYAVTGQDFLQVAMSAPVGESLYDVLAHASESFALAKQDVSTGESDSEGRPVYVSFFAGAAQV